MDAAKINSMAKIVDATKSRFAPGTQARPPSVAPAQWGSEVIFEGRSSKRKIAPGFKPSAGVNRPSIFWRQRSHTYLYELRLAVESIVSDLTWRLSVAQQIEAEVSLEPLRREIEQFGLDVPLAESSPGDNLVLAQLVEELAELLSIEQSSHDESVPLSDVRDEYMFAYEKAIWMTLYGKEMRIHKDGVAAFDPVLDRRLIQNIPGDLVTYWWSRFPDPKTGLPFPSQYLLFRHLKDDVLDKLSEIETTVAFNKGI